jgi:hypothetical protein
MSEQQKENQPSFAEQTTQEIVQGPKPTTRRLGGLLVGCLLTIFLLSILVTAICAVIGLITGYLWLPPGRGGLPIELYGIWARVVSAIILFFYGIILFLVFRQNRKRRRPKILGD